MNCHGGQSDDDADDGADDGLRVRLVSRKGITSLSLWKMSCPKSQNWRREYQLLKIRWKAGSVSALEGFFRPTWTVWIDSSIHMQNLPRLWFKKVSTMLYFTWKAQFLYIVKDRTVVQLGKGNGILIKIDPIGGNSAPRFGQREVVAVPEGFFFFF